ncbi:aminopeptidase P N-terminal domain-containing protein [Sulfurimonas sp.]|uniref:aminopeptidase P N-terminal domain-containing protein n=1 Tax=Sulfurimonas sp. TaxID=2022749 RepID=UPI002B4A4197|nr:aminopeptidase P N-terminal domain-containing protein [Sulfurimonas sp.]
MIKKSEYKQRRDRFLKKLKNNSMAIFSSAKTKTRSNDTEYPYRQDSNFYYLTGFKEDNSYLIFIKENQKTKSFLFVKKKEAKDELWHGKRLGRQEAKKRFSFDKVLISKKFKSLKKELKTKFKIDENASHNISKMRLIKSKAEIKLIKKAINITKIAHHRAIRFDKIDKNEYELQAEIEYVFKKNGSYSDAYTSIVASGDNANTLHYIENKQVLVDGDLILIDAGCEYEYYASDITRTIPVNGRFSQAQKELYSIVLDVEKKIIKMIKPNVKRTTLQKNTEILLTKGMIEKGILKGNYKKLIKNNKHKKYYPHGIGHWMGLDVHDDAPYKDKNNKELKLQKGMVLTIEPGIYISKDDKTVPKKFRGIGIRIEDDILVTKNSYKNLSSKIAKSINDIETMCYKYKTNQ